MATKQQVINLFNKACYRWGNAVKPAKLSNPTYTPSSDSEIVFEHVFINKTLRVEYNKNQIDGTSVEVGDFQLMFLADDLTFDIGSNLSIERDGFNLNIINFSLDPVGATYTLQVRAV